MKQYICPVCKGLNEEHRTYCKECGTWLLNSKYPAKEFKSSYSPSNKVQKGNKSKTKALYIMGSIIFFVFLLPLLSSGMVDNKSKYILTIISLLGLCGFVISLFVLFLMLFNDKLKSSRNEFLGLLIFSFFSFFIGIVLTSGESVSSTATVSKPSLNTYKSIAKIMDYRDMARNADTYAGEMVKIKGKVIQKVNGTQQQITVDVSGEGDMVYIFRKDDAGNLLEDDQVEVYGSIKGLETYKAWTGVKYTVPSIESDYVILTSVK